MDNAKLQYNFFPHYYIDNKNTYETMLCECLNASSKMVDMCGGNFSLISEQENKQPDVKAENSGYEIDFKMMISESLKEFQSRTSPIKEEIAPGVTSIHQPHQFKKKVVLIWNCCRNIDKNRLEYLRTQNDMEAKAVTHFFDKVINTNKNILLFIPVFFSTTDRTIKSEEQYKTIFKEISDTTQYIYDYRNEIYSGFDTFLIYAVNIPEQNEFNFIITKLSPNGLETIDKVSVFSLKSVQKRAIENL